MPDRLTKYCSTAIVMSLLLIMGLLLFQIEGTYQIGMPLLSIGVAIVRPLPFRKWTFIDVILGSIMFYNIVSCFYSSCTTPAVYTAFFSVFCMIAYLALRRLSDTPHLLQMFLQGNCIPMAIALLLAICSFFIFRSSILDAGFEDTYHFRFLFRPLGYITNVWAEVLIIILGWVCLTRRFSIFLCFLTIFSLLLSFSRGAYIALFVYLIAWAISAESIKRKLSILSAGIAAMIIIATGFPSETKTTLSMNGTTSQQRSTEWRINAIESTWETVKEYPFFGWGNNSYTFAIDRSLNQNSTQNYTSFAPNLPVLLLVEKGFIGMILYLLLAITVCFYLWKHRRETDVGIIGCILLALLTKEMTQATLISTPFTCFSIYILLAFMQKKEKSNGTIDMQTERGSYLAPGMALIIYFFALIFNHKQTCNENYCKDSFAELNQGNIEKATQLMEKTGKQIPYLIQRGILYTECYLKTKELLYAEKAELFFSEAHERQPKDVQILYLQAYLFQQKGEIGKASASLKNLSGCYPKNSLYLYALGECLYHAKNKKEALSCWKDAIFCTPRLLTMKRFKELEQNDPFFYEDLKQQLCKIDTSKLVSPIEWAHYGYIMHQFGYLSTAKLYLKKAVAMLPNLTTPWHLLGEERKYRLLSLGAFQKDASTVSIPLGTNMTSQRLLQLAYKAKFQIWYDSNLIISSSIP